LRFWPSIFPNNEKELYHRHMKPLPPPDVPGQTPAERMDNALRMALSPGAVEAVRKEKARMKRVAGRRKKARELSR
jgi:hypothetical protein